MKLGRFPLLLACVLLVGLAPGYARAETPSDFSLDAIQRLSPAEVGPEETVTTSYTTSGPREANYTSFVFSSKVGKSFYVTGWDGEASQQTNRYQASGPYQLEWVLVSWSAGNNEIFHTYFRDGTVRYNTDDPAEPVDAQHSLDFAAVDFSVDNPAEDVTTPELHSLSVEDAEGLVPGEQLRINFDARDAQTRVEWIGFIYEGPDGRRRYLSAYGQSAEDPIPTFASTQVKNGWPGGTYHLIEVEIYDAAGMGALYLPDGSIEKWPSKATGPSSHSLDFSAADVTIDNPDADLDPPRLTSLSQDTGSVYFPGETAVFTYEAEDVSGVENLYLSWQSAQSGEGAYDARWFGTPEERTADGRVEVEMDYWMDLGAYELRRIGLTDNAENSIDLLRDGSSYDSWDDVFIGNHPTDLSVGDFELVPWPHSFRSLVGGASIEIDFVTGKFHVGYTPCCFSEIQLATISTLPNGAYRAVYSGEGETLEGIFDLDSGAFTATYSSDGEVITLIGAASLP